MKMRTKKWKKNLDFFDFFPGLAPGKKTSLGRTKNLITKHRFLLLRVLEKPFRNLPNPGTNQPKQKSPKPSRGT